MSTHTQRLSVLRQRGWKCERPDYQFDALTQDKKPVRSVALLGALWGNVKHIYLGVSDGLVMITEDGRDVLFEEFLRWLDLPSDPAEVKVSDRQKNLFD